MKQSASVSWAWSKAPLPTTMLWLAMSVAVGLSTPTSAQTPHTLHGQHHAAHGIEAPTEVRARTVEVSIPKAEMTREDGRTVEIRQEIAVDGGTPVFVDFIFTSCTSVCPVLSQTFADVQEKLAQTGQTARFVSISIDTEVDTVARIKAYGEQFGKGPDWHFYTGAVAASSALQRAFGVEVRDKMGHPPAIFFYSGKGKNWTRFDGFASPEQLAALVGTHTQSHTRHRHH